jgi:hypothetical protein
MLALVTPFMYFWSTCAALAGYILIERAEPPVWVSLACVYIWVHFGMILLSDLPKGARDP